MEKSLMEEQIEQHGPNGSNSPRTERLSPRMDWRRPVLVRVGSLNEVVKGGAKEGAGEGGFQLS